MRRSSAVLRVLALCSVGVFSIAGLPDNGLPDNGLPDNGLPDNGLPDNGNSPDALINTPLFFNRALHAWWVGHPFNAATVGAAGSPLNMALSDTYSALVMSYVWQLCHPAGSDAKLVASATGKKYVFQGRLGLCVRSGGHGWHRDTTLDAETARWLSASIITQVNRYAVHNRFSLRGPLANQLTAMAPTMTSYTYKFGTHDKVGALNACSGAATGKAPCGWKPHYVGVGAVGSKVRINARSNGARMLLQVNLGIHGANPGQAGAIAISGNSGVIDPKVEFTVPAGGTFNVQWAADPRPMSRTLPATVKPPKLTATLIAGGGTLRFPADEVFAFVNREMYSTSMLFNLGASDNNIASIPGVTSSGQKVASCEASINSKGSLQFCVGAATLTEYNRTMERYRVSTAAATTPCTPCRRTPRRGAKTVVFPNANMWLSSSWTNAQDYYELRSCSSDLSSCVANFRGLIESKCDVQSKSVDSASPRPYAGPAEGLQDAFKCHIGSGPDTGFGVTTFFANYGNAGACWATKPGSRACGYKSRGCEHVKGKQAQKQQGPTGDCARN